jgi:ammonia channel protein AmtB
MLDALVGYIAYWAVGFGVANGNEGGNAFMGLQALFSFDVKTVSHVTNWFLQLVFAANAATIVSGKTFTENWDSKRHLLELSWPI